jgi:hypothetical protein
MTKKRVYGVALFVTILAAPLAAQNGIEREAQDRAQIRSRDVAPKP